MKLKYLNLDTLDKTNTLKGKNTHFNNFLTYKQYYSYVTCVWTLDKTNTLKGKNTF